MGKRKSTLKNILFVILCLIIVFVLLLLQNSKTDFEDLLTDYTTTSVQGEKYNREKHFGKAWLDIDRNNCDTRNDVLLRDLLGAELIPRGRGISGCPDKTVIAGVLQDPYTGQKITFHRGAGKSKDGGVQIDHVVALKDSWKRGSDKWDQKTREQFANDPENLLAVDGVTNMKKGDKNTSEWLPPNKAFRCEYVRKYNKVLAKYKLEVTKQDLKIEKQECGIIK